MLITISSKKYSEKRVSKLENIIGKKSLQVSFGCAKKQKEPDMDVYFKINKKKLVGIVLALPDWARITEVNS